MTFRAMKILDPENRFVVKWKRLMLIIGMLNMILDPYFLYIFNARGPKCLGVDVQAAKLLSFFRTLLDLFMLFNMILNFFIAIQVPGPRVFKKRNLIRDPCLIAINYMKSMFIADLLAIQPFPQIIIWSKYITETHLMETRKLLPMIILLQFTVRAFPMLPYNVNVIMEALGLARNNLWSGAIYNLFIFVLIGHYLGAIYYQVYMKRQQQCFYDISKDVPSIVHDCSQLHKDCIFKHKELDQGMLSDAFQNEIGLRSFLQKVIYCFVWGVRSLSSLGQIFESSYIVAESIFSCGVIILGLIFLADLIARMQTSVQSAGARRDKQRLKQRKLEEWTHYHHLPPVLKGLVRQSAISEWQGTKGIDDEAILDSLPHDLQRDIRTHLYKKQVLNICPFSRMDEQLLNFICGHLKTLIKAEGTYIVLQGDPLDQVLFIFTGVLQLTTHHGSGRSNSRNLEAGDFFGDDLLTWASQPNSSTQNLPHSNVTVKCISNVEAFCLPAEHLRLLVVFNYIHRFQRALREHHA